MIVMRLACTPCDTREFIADLARRAPSARLYSLVPRSSQWPSMRTRRFRLVFSHDALESRTFASSGRISYLSKSKKASRSAAIAMNSAGAGRAVAGRDSPPPPGAAGAGAAGPLGELGSGPGPATAGGVVGAGAETEVVAGCFAQAAITTADSTSDIVKVKPRVTMTPPLSSLRTHSDAEKHPITAGAGTTKDLCARRAF